MVVTTVVRCIPACTPDSDPRCGYAHIFATRHILCTGSVDAGGCRSETHRSLCSAFSDAWEHYAAHPLFFSPAESSSQPQAFEGQSLVLVRSTVRTMDGTLCTAKGSAGDRLALSRRRASKVLGREKPDLHLSVFSPMMMIHAMLFYVSSTFSVSTFFFSLFAFAFFYSM